MGKGIIKVMEERDKYQKFLSFQVNRKVKNLYKHFLFILEDMNADGYNISEDDFQRYRKRILDHGNDTVRELEEYLENFDVKLK